MVDSDSASLGSNPSPPANVSKEWVKRPGRTVCDPLFRPGAPGSEASELRQQPLEEHHRQGGHQSALGCSEAALVPQQSTQNPDIPAPTYRLVRGKPRAEYGGRG